MNENEDIKNLVELKKQILNDRQNKKEKEQVDRLAFFATEKSKKEIEQISDSKTIGSNHFLSQYLPLYLKSMKPSATPIDFTNEEQKLENEFMDKMLPFLVKQTLVMEANDSFQPENESGYNVGWAYKLGIATMDNTLQKIIIERAEISLQKIVDKQMISSKDYGFIITKIALYEGNCLNLSEYNMLYFSLYQELTKNHGFGSYADEYLKRMLVKNVVYHYDSKFFPEDQIIGIKKK